MQSIRRLKSHSIPNIPKGELGKMTQMGFRVYIAKNTFTTLIDHFTSFAALQLLINL